MAGSGSRSAAAKKGWITRRGGGGGGAKLGAKMTASQWRSMKVKGAASRRHGVAAVYDKSLSTAAGRKARAFQIRAVRAAFKGSALRAAAGRKLSSRAASRWTG
jgi:hypothetical protein